MNNFYLFTVVVIAIFLLSCQEVSCDQNDSEFQLSETIDSPEVKLKIATFKENAALTGIQKSFSNLPTDELERLLEQINTELSHNNTISSTNTEVDQFTIHSLLEVKIEPYTIGASVLRRCWDIRQAELKQMALAQLNPVAEVHKIMNTIYAFVADSQSVYEHPEQEGNLDNNLRGSVGEVSHSEKYDNVTSSLLNLEYLLEDMDNARDFHQIGEWDRLVALLESPYMSSHHKALVAWCMGTAIKNTDTFQEWMIEAPEASVSASPLHLLLQLLFNSTVDVDDWDKYGESVNTADPEMVNRLETELQNKILYALSSASSNNSPVQKSLLEYIYQNNTFEVEMIELLNGPVLHELKTVSLERVRKIWNLVSDLVEFALDKKSDVDVDANGTASVPLIRSIYCSSAWDMLVSDHLEMASADSSTDAVAVRYQEQLLEQECVQTAIMNQEKGVDTVGSNSNTISVGADDVALVVKKRKNLVAGAHRTLLRLQDNLQLLCN